MIDLKNSQFWFEVVVKLESLPALRRYAPPGLSSISVNSIRFDDFEQCAVAANMFLEDVIERANEDGEVFIGVPEINPAFSAQPAHSENWEDDELSRIWILNEAEVQNHRISKPHGQIQIFAG